MSYVNDAHATVAEMIRPRKAIKLDAPLDKAFPRTFDYFCSPYSFPDRSSDLRKKLIYYFSVFMGFMLIVSSIFRNLDAASVVRFLSLDKLARVKHSTLYML